MVGKKPVSAVPTPRINSDHKASDCSRMNSKTSTTAKDRNPGTSRRLCNMPISAPVNAARSMAKLLIRLDQVAKLKGTAEAINSRRISGRRQLDGVQLDGVRVKCQSRDSGTLL
jgi:hypothetical protein